MSNMKDLLGEVDFEEFEEMLHNNDLSNDEIAIKLFPEGTNHQRDWIVYYIQNYRGTRRLSEIQSYIAEQKKLGAMEWN